MIAARMWSDDLFQAIRDAQVRQVAYVPDAGHARLIDACRRAADLTAVPLTTEEEGVALLAGAWLGGQRGVLLMQSSGVGNCVNMLSMVRSCRFPLVMFVTMRGQWNEFNPWQVPMGETTAAALSTAGVAVSTAAAPEDVGAMAAAALDAAFVDGQAVALLLHQSLMPVKTFGKGDAAR